MKLKEPNATVSLKRTFTVFTHRSWAGFVIQSGLILLVTGLLLAGCASAPEEPEIVYATRPTSEVEELLRNEADRWMGTSYRLGGVSRKGVDCSGLVMQVYKRLFDIRLPRTTSRQARVGVVVSRGQWQPGDLVFFQPPRKARHVGIYLGEGEFVHTSSSRGVMISYMDDDYWRQAYWQARRVL